METNVHYTLVGLFVILLTAVIVVAVAWMTTGFKMNEYTLYKVYMTEPVSGLTSDEPVEFNGVAVGKIKDIVINKHNPELVEILLSIKSDTPVTRGTVATLSLRGLTGVTYISLEDKGEDRAPLLAAADQLYPVIKTKPSILVRLDTILTQLNQSFGKITNGFDKIGNSISALLSRENIHTFKGFLNSGKNSFNTLQTKTLPAANETITQYGDLAHELSETVQEIKQNPSALLRGQGRPEPGPGE